MFSLTLYFQVEFRQTLLGRLKIGLCESGTCSTQGKNATRIQNFSRTHAANLTSLSELQVGRP